MTPGDGFSGLVPTEQVNPKTRNIDLLSTRHILDKINEEDQWVPHAVQRAIGDIVPVVDAVVRAFQRDGRLFYIGAGTSGRLGVLDASECPPTYGVSPDLVQGIIAGGDIALRFSVEGAEDSEDGGIQDIQASNITENDVVIGISASGGAPYVLGAMAEAKRRGATTAAITCTWEGALAKAVDYPIIVIVGPEVVTGSSRMKAGTAQKLILNMISTAAMIQTGKTYENLMVDVQPTNRKLRERAKRIVATIAGVSEYMAAETLEKTNHQVKPAIVMLKLGVSLDEAQRRLQEASGKLRIVLGDEYGEPELESEPETAY